MRNQVIIHANVIEPDTYDELICNYTEAVFRIIKNRVAPEFIEDIIGRIENSDNDSEIGTGVDINASSSYIQP